MARASRKGTEGPPAETVATVVYSARALEHLEATFEFLRVIQAPLWRLSRPSDRPCLSLTTLARLTQTQAGVDLVAPEPFEPIRRKLGVAHRMHDVSVPEIVLDGPGVVTVVREFVAARMSEHVRVHGEGQTRK